MENVYFTVAGLHHYFGVKMFERGMEVELIKEPDNEYELPLQPGICGSIRKRRKSKGGQEYVENSHVPVLFGNGKQRICR